MPEKNDTAVITATGLTDEGMGVGRVDGMAVFVFGLLPGESAEIRIIKKLKSYAIARTERMLEESQERVLPVCPVFRECGGCTHMHMTYQAQLEAKTVHVADCLRKFSGTALRPQPCIPSPKELYYRNKISLPLAFDGLLRMGCYKKHTHDVVDAEKCFIADESFARVAAMLRRFIESRGISVYDERTNRGLLRHIVLRRTSTGELMCGIIANSAKLPCEDELEDVISPLGVTTAVLNVNTRPGNVILGDKTQVIYGRGRVRERILSCSFDISLNTFLQVNHAQTEQLYSHVLSLLGDDAGVAVDLFCGAGTITLNAAPHARRIYGIEIVPPAIEDARANAALNGITNAEFICADCEKALPEITAREGRIDVIIADPPRKGMTPELIGGIAASGAARLIYVSCDPATLARDIKLLSEAGLKPVSAQPFDMFPQTGHVETVVLLSRKAPNDHIEVDLDLDELDATSAETKATYEEIKDYVLKETGLRVSSLYISQIKRKCGLEVGENYNLAKNENARVPQCPQDKEKAIRAALKHFAMI